MNNIRTGLLLVFLSVLSFSCVKEAETGRSFEEGLPATIEVLAPFAARSIGDPIDGDAADSEIQSVRVLVFNATTGSLEHHMKIPTLVPEKRFTLNMTTGTYDFVFIANETSDAALSSRLDTFAAAGKSSKLSGLDGESFAVAAFSDELPIPAAAIYKGVKVINNNTVEYPKSSYETGSARKTVSGAEWPVYVERLGIRLNLTLRTASETLTNTTNIVISNIPSKVFLFNPKTTGQPNPNHDSGTVTGDKTIAIPSGEWVEDGNGYKWTKQRIILPENSFDPPYDSKFGRYSFLLTVNFANGNPRSSRMGIGMHTLGEQVQNANMSSPRNYVFNMTGTFTEAEPEGITFDGEVVPWDDYLQKETDITARPRMQPEANSFLVKPGSDPIGITIPRHVDNNTSFIGDLFEVEGVMKAHVLWSVDGNGDITEGSDALSPDSPVRAIRLVKNNNNLRDTYLLVTPGMGEGNAFVSIYADLNQNGVFDPYDHTRWHEDGLGDLTLWYCHIWVSNDAETILAGDGFMDRNLGALSTDWATYPPSMSDYDPVRGLLYQIGRETPFHHQTELTTIPDPGNVQPLDVRAYFTTVAIDGWRETMTPPENSYIWGNNGKKTAFDPCPAGWRVPGLEAFMDGADINDWRYGYNMFGRFWPATVIEDGEIIGCITDDEDFIREFTGKPTGLYHTAVKYDEIFVSAAFNDMAAWDAFNIFDKLGSVRCVREDYNVITGVGNNTEPWSENRYVGAFWRNDQTGERIISGGNSAHWMVTVDEGADWVKLSTAPSRDTHLYTNAPGDAENHQVTNGSAMVQGYGNIYFRIGLTGVNPTPWAPRYATLTVSADDGSGSYTIYLRQGEEADYLHDASYRWSPYNLTDLTGRGKGMRLGVDMKHRGGRWTEYPSQTGYMFSWNSTVGFYPGSIENGRYYDVHNNWSAAREVCPKGYRTPPSEAFLDGFGLRLVEEWGNVIIGEEGVDEFVTGMYADGYMDRRKLKIELSQLDTPSSVFDIYAGDGSTIACPGALFYDTASKRSIYLPMGIIDKWQQADEIFSPLIAFYRSSSPKLYDPSGGIGMYIAMLQVGGDDNIIDGGVISITEQPVSTKGPVRCIKE